MGHELWCVNGSGMTKITPLVGSITWRSNINELGEQLDFDIAFNDDRYFPKSPVDLGSLIILKNGEKEVNRTIVITENKSGRGSIPYNCFDYAFYLNKSEETYQFNKMNSNGAINEVLARAGVPIGGVDIPSILLTKIYADKVHSEVIKDILDLVEKETCVKCRMEMKEGKLFIFKQNDKIIVPTFKLATNLPYESVTNAMSNPSRKRTIEEMKNSIKVIINNEDKIRLIDTVQNSELINQYGLLQKLVQVDRENISEAKVVAQNMLKDLGRVFEENSIDIPGHDDIRAGRLIEIEEPLTGMKGKYLIENANHTVTNGIHLCSVNLGVI
ncbi:hypothetical protein NE686_16745 [Tissierella carlieri]|uniref:YqbQ/XkdQ domain-containing protein n=1 Tax=Tissierella carlieri TaxID=689904 RepID=A0ABT1SE50_9FIRM|nr:hypothetical protein [Tissierella carlieri]MCQ4924754.1 hypothetical protein [Tissierella carlieri]